MIHKINEPKFEPDVHDSRSQTGKRPPPAVHLQQAQAQSNISNNNNNNTKSTQESRNQAASNQAQVAAATAAFLAAQTLPTNHQLPTFVQPFAQSQLASHPINPFITSGPPSLPLVNKPKDRNSPSVGRMLSSAPKHEETKPSYLSALASKTTPVSSSDGGQSR